MAGKRDGDVPEPAARVQIGEKRGDKQYQRSSCVTRPGVARGAVPAPSPQAGASCPPGLQNPTVFTTSQHKIPRDVFQRRCGQLNLAANAPAGWSQAFHFAPVGGVLRS